MTIYYYNKSPVAVGRLRDDIEAEPGIVTGLDYLRFRGPDNIEISFSGTLSGGEETALDTVVSGHSGIHDPQPAVLPSGDLGAEAMLFTDGFGITRWATGFSTAVSGVDPVEDSDISTKYYADQGDIDDFLELTDTPTTYSGYADYLVTVNPTETGLMFNNVATVVSGNIYHSWLLGLDSDDHEQYVPTDGGRGFTSTVSGVYPIEDYHLTTKEYVDFAVTTLSGLFSGYNQFATSEAESSTTSTTFQEKLTTTISGLSYGAYRIGWYYQWQQVNSNFKFLAQIQVNDTDIIMTHEERPANAGTWTSQSGFYYLTASGTIQADLDFATESVGKVCSIRNARIEFWRVE
jgi:hypothetical protein